MDDWGYERDLILFVLAQRGMARKLASGPGLGPRFTSLGFVGRKRSAQTLTGRWQALTLPDPPKTSQCWLLVSSWDFRSRLHSFHLFVRGGQQKASNCRTLLFVCCG